MRAGPQRVPRLRHHAARRRPAGGPQPLGRRQARPSRGSIDGLGVGYIEGGWPGANPKDTEFFRRAREELDLRHATLAAFGATRRAGVPAADDPLVAALRDSGAGVVTLVAKSHDRHVELALRTTLEENLAMVRDTVDAPARRGPAGVPRRRALLRRLPRQPRLRPRGAAHGVRRGGRGRRAVRHQRRHAAAPGSADVVDDVLETTGVRVGIHCHNDTGCAVANTLAAVDAGRDARAGHAQRLRRAHRQRRPGLGGRQPRAQAGPPRAARRAACATRPGSRTRSPRSRTSRRRRASRTSASSAFAHKAGLHASAIKVDPNLYQHMEPAARRQRHAAAGLRHGGSREHRAQGRRARLRPRRRPGAGQPDHPAGQGRWSRAATPSRPPTRRSSCCSSRRSRAPVRRTSTSSRGA